MACTTCREPSGGLQPNVVRQPSSVQRSVGTIPVRVTRDVQPPRRPQTNRDKIMDLGNRHGKR
jgi:hypothetical protein